jgi:ankyrin repeat protein
MNDLVQAAFDGDVEQVIRLLDAGASVNSEGSNWNPLHAAIENQNFACVELLIRRGANVEYRGAAMVTPLAHAVDMAIDGAWKQGENASEEPTGIINLLLEAGADPKPGLEVARQYNSRKMIELLTNAMKPG